MICKKQLLRACLNHPNSLGAPDRQKFFLTVLPDGLAVHMDQRFKRYRHGVAYRPDGRFGIAMGAALRFADDLVNYGESHEIVRRDLHISGCVLSLGSIAPQYRRCTFW